MHYQPIGDDLRDAERAAEYVRSLPEALRPREVDLFVLLAELRAHLAAVPDRLSELP